MLKKLGALALVALVAAPAARAEGMVRLRAIEILPDSQSSPVGGVEVSNKLAPDLDLSWLFTKNIAAELVLTYPQQHHVNLNGTNLGEVSHLPPTLLVQYRLPLGEHFVPYAGVGVNYTYFTDRHLDGGLQLERSSIGPALQVGLDYLIEGHWYANLDVKKIWIDSDVGTPAGGFVTHLKINPLVAGVGVGYRF